jgi:VIT1/CCC1 family predicted Fe2+/Mn2+ transporter
MYGKHVTELELIPQEEREELVHFFTSKGLTRTEASGVADRLMQNPEAALTALSRDELGIDHEAPVNPPREGIITGISTGLGAVIPLLPFMFIPGPAAIWTGMGISRVAHFISGASRAIFTGRPAIRSGLEMFAVGMGGGAGHLPAGFADRGKTLRFTAFTIAR